MLFASALILDREPLQWGQFSGAANLWCQNAGAVAAVGLGIWVLANFLQRRRPFATLLADAPRQLIHPLSALLAVLAALSLAGFVMVGGIGLVGAYSPGRRRLDAQRGPRRPADRRRLHPQQRRPAGA